MRINNRKIKPIIKFIYTLILLGLLASVLFSIVEINFLKTIPIWGVVVIALTILLIIYLRGDQLFEYDSDGEALNFRTQDAFWGDIFPKTKKSSEFPKEKLVSFQITGFFLKRTLCLTIKSKRSQSGFSKLKYNITYLNSQERRDLKRSLKKVIEDNKAKELI